jgi:hypothetical protein
VPIGPVVSDVIAEIVASAVDVELSKTIAARSIDCEIVRFKDDYRILVRSEADGRAVVKHLQAALKLFNLELSDEKTSICELPDGLFREWASMYHAVRPRVSQRYTWKQFRELYLAVLRIDKACPGTGVIDRFLADLVTSKGEVRVPISSSKLQRVMSMLLMMASQRIKAFPKVIAIIEAILRSPSGRDCEGDLLGYLETYLNQLAEDEERNKYLISWISYFIVSNGLKPHVKTLPTLKDPITRGVWCNENTLYPESSEYKLFLPCEKAREKRSLLGHLDVFNPPSS